MCSWKHVPGCKYILQEPFSGAASDRWRLSPCLEDLKKQLLEVQRKEAEAAKKDNLEAARDLKKQEQQLQASVAACAQEAKEESEELAKLQDELRRVRKEKKEAKK